MMTSSGVLEDVKREATLSVAVLSKKDIAIFFLLDIVMFFFKSKILQNVVTCHRNTVPKVGKYEIRAY